MIIDSDVNNLPVDADAHVVESARTWDFMDSSEKQYRPIPLETSEENGIKLQFWVIDGQVRGHRLPAFSEAELQTRSRQVGRKFAESEESRELGNVDMRLEHMNRIGVGVQVLHNTIFVQSATERAAVEVALYRCWNHWLADIWRQGKGRLRWSCMAPTLSITDALDQIRFSKENGACAVLMRPIEGNRLLSDPYFYPIYDEASRLDMPIAVHIANGNPWLTELYRPGAGLHRFRVPTIAGFNDVLLSEIPQLFPKLRWGFIEAGSQWLPWSIHEAKKRFTTLGREWSENFARDYRMFVTCENSDDLPYIVDQAGEDCLVIGTDYGHTDPSSDVDAIKVFKARTDLTPQVKQKILSDNAKVLYGL